MRKIHRATRLIGVASVLIGFALTACQEGELTSPIQGGVLAGRAAVSNTETKLNVALCSPSRGGFTINFTNPYFPVVVGAQSVFQGDENGDSVRLQITVLNRTRAVAGVTTRVIEEREWENGQLLEVSWNYYAQARDRTVCYLGEDVDIYQNSTIVHDGAWCGVAPNQPGIFMPADPRSGLVFQMEVAPGIAEDEGKIVGIGPTEVPFADYAETIRVREFNPLDGGKGYKIYAAGTGLIVDGPVELTARNQTSGNPEAPLLTQQLCGS